MAIKPSEIQLQTLGGATLVSGAMNNLFGDGNVGGATDYAFVVIRNANSTLTLTSPKLWLGLDPKGAAMAVAIADGGIARGESYNFPSIDPSGLSYSSPTSQSSGLALPTLTPLARCLVAVRRVFSSATTAYPESNRIILAGTSPL